jgi:hypothetical protein
MITLRGPSRGFPKVFHQKERYWLEECRERIRRYDIARL